MSHNLFFFIQNYGLTVLATLIFICFACINSSLHKSIIKNFRLAAFSILFLTIADAVQAYLATLPYPTVVRMIAGGAGYVLRVAVIYFVLMLYKRNTVSQILLFTLPLALTFLVSVMAFFTKISFYYTETNEIVRGPLVVIPFFACIFYFFALIYETFREVHMVDHRESLLVCIVFIFAVVATTMEMQWNFLSAVPGVSIVGLTSYYIYFLSNKYTKDRLTDAFTRDRLYLDVQKTDAIYGIIGFDVNDLKIINDRDGHQAGDRALATVAATIGSCMNSRSRLYRIGGDEFVVIYFTDSYDDLKSLEQNIRTAISKTDYNVAAGAALREKNQPFEAVISAADKAMYENKRNQKARKNLN